MIRLTENYVIDADSNCYTFGQMLTDKNGKESVKALGYYSTLKQALEAAKRFYVRKCLSEGEYTLCEAISAVEETNGRFEEMIKRVSDGSMKRSTSKDDTK